MGGAALTSNVSGLVLYEPSLGLAYPAGSVDAVEVALARGDHEAALSLVLVTVLEMSEEDVEAMRSTPGWDARVASAPTVPRECRAEEGWVYRPGQFDAITAPTLVLTGSESPAVVKQVVDDALAAISGARVRVLEGHGHVAHRTDPAMVASIIKELSTS